MDFKYLIGGLFVFILGIYVCISGYNLGIGDLDDPGTGMVVFLAGSVMALLSIVDIIKGLTSKEVGIRAFLSLWEGTHWKKTAFVLIESTIYTLLILNGFGFLIVTPLYVVVLMRSLGPQTWLRLIGASIFCTLAFYILTYYFTLPISALPEFLDF